MTTFDFFARHRLGLFPLVPNGSAPATETPYDDVSTEPAQWARWQAAGRNFALPMGANRLLAVDIDTKHGDGVAEWRRWCADHELDPDTYPPAWTTPSGGAHLLFWRPEGVAPETLRNHAIKAGVVDTRAAIQSYLAVPPSVRDGRRYAPWPGGIVISAAPAALIEHCTRSTTPRAAGATKPGTRNRDDVAELVKWLAEHGAFETYADWVSLGMSLKIEFGDDGLELWEAATWAEASELVDDKWDSFATEPTSSSVTLGTWLKKAHETGWRGSVRPSLQAMFGQVATIAEPAPDVMHTTPAPAPTNALTAARGEILPDDSDDALALEFASRHADTLRYVADEGRWLNWDGVRWRPDRTMAAYDLVREHLRDAARNVNFRDSAKITSAQRVAAVERMAKTDRRIVATSDQWDADPLLLGTPGGTLDLRTGRLRPARPEDGVTKLTAVAPAGACPLWLSFLNKSLAGDAELIAFVQRALGYSLTGITREHAMFFPIGTGANGKGVFLNTVSPIFADYATTTPVETFLASSFEKHPTDIAGLAGRRLVVANEVPKGRVWNESRLTQLTGGDRVSGRFMRQDFFEFVPQFKLFVVGNHRPRVQSVNTAIRRRMHLIPFNVTIP